MQINSREDLRIYVLRRLGHPVIKINVEETQLQDRIDDAIAYFQSYSGEAQTDSFYKHVLSETEINNKQAVLPPDIIAVKQAMAMAPGSFPSWMTAEYQVYIMELKDLMGGSLESYFITQRHLSLLNFMLSKTGTTFSFNSYTNSLQLYTSWGTLIPNKSFLVLEVTKKVSPEQFPNLYNSYYLRELAYYFCLRQWATNLKKYANIPLPGGVTLNAQEMLDEANTKIDTLGEQMKSASDPMPFFIMG